MKLSRILIRTPGLGATVLGLFAAIGCGSGSTNIIHTTGNYSNASLNGTYVYEIHGDSLGGFYREIGAFTADGAGNITAGSDDSSFNSGGLPVNFTGSYTVGNDGTGFVTFNSSAVAQGGAITLAITLVSSSKVDLMEADFFADSVGTAELQTASAIAANPGTFVFRLHQESSAQSSSSSAAQVGLVNVSGSTVTGGTMDQNLGGVSSQLTLTGGIFGAPGTLGRGTATLEVAMHSDAIKRRQRRVSVKGHRGVYYREKAGGGRTYCIGYTGADGVKTGSTDAAGRVIVGSAVHNGHRVYVVVMHSDDTLADATALFDWAWQEFAW